MILTTFTLFHVAVSLFAILAGFVVTAGMLAANSRERWTRLFIATTAFTSVSGFLFPAHHFLPSHAVGIVSLLVLPIAIFARYRRGLARHWRPIYAFAATLLLYLNVFVLVAQTFSKVPALRSLAPTQSEPPFIFTQFVVLVVFLVGTIFAVARFSVNRPSLAQLLVQS